MSAPRAQEDDLELVEVPFGSDLYRRALALREAILRVPLGLSLSPDELADDARRQHFCAISRGAVVGSVSMEPLDGETVQLRQMAVMADRRLEGIGTRLLACGEGWAQSQGYRTIVLNARLDSNGFYARSGYRAEGEPFEENTVPHIRMTKRLATRWSRVTKEEV
ncbi:MAG TPA: GNAT family N-acetyltransferase [Methyloceanibacter sp.]|nr:GNAT family N-acetyltransferase [Methyloceanibacter sp.]